MTSFSSQKIFSHKNLLNQFFEIANQHGIMLSEKKIQLAQSQNDLLGMHFFRGTCQPQPQIAQELLNFLDEFLTVKQIQQFLGIVNYIRDFIPRAAQYTSSLSKLLKKNSSPWSKEQTIAVKELKKVAQNPPALKIPGTDQKILQTDTSDHYWEVILME